jgi:hypothetical protein
MQVLSMRDNKEPRPEASLFCIAWNKGPTELLQCQVFEFPCKTVSLVAWIRVGLRVAERIAPLHQGDARDKKAKGRKRKRRGQCDKADQVP